MALRAVTEHPKFADLKHRLGSSKAMALGSLECLWHFAAKFTPRGNIGKYADTAIEAWVEWPGEPGAMIQAMVDSEWIHRHDEFRLVIHDWSDHADETVNTTLARNCETFWDGKVPKSGRLNQHERTKFREWAETPVPEAPRRKQSGRVSQRSADLPEKSADTPIPVPEPVPVPEPGPEPESDEVSARAALELVRAAGPYIPPPPKIPVDFDGDVLFEELYSQHPRKGYRGMAQNLLAEAVAGGADPAEIKRVHRLCCPVWRRDRNPEIASGTLAQWLIDKGWRYPPEPDAAENPAVRQRPASRLSVLDRLKPRSG